MIYRTFIVNVVTMKDVKGNVLGVSTVYGDYSQRKLFKKVVSSDKELFADAKTADYDTYEEKRAISIENFVSNSELVGEIE